MKHSKKYNPELAFIIKNMDNTSIPSKKGYRVNTDGVDTLIRKKKYYFGYDYSHKKKDKEEKKINIIIFEKNFHIYYYSSLGQYLYSENVDFKKDYSNTQRQKAEKLVTETIDPIVKAQQKPKINLQWMFNMIYTKKFS